MIRKNETTLTKGLDNKKLVVVREFEAPVEEVWKAWTDSNLLDSWWAPKPWKARTKSIDFREGGVWLYAMVGPDGTEQWCCVKYNSIAKLKYFTATDSFCDENGNPNNDLPNMNWKNNFSSTSSGTKVTVEISFDSVSDLEKILEMGFQEGFTAAHGNLDELLGERIKG